MRFSFILSALSAASLVVADGAAIVTAIEGIQNATLALNSSVASFNGNPLQALPISEESSQLLNAINSATKVAQASGNLSNIEAITIAGSTQTLSKIVISTLSEIVAKKPTFDRDLILSPIILINLEQEQSASDKFTAAVTAKVPAALQASAKQLTEPIDAAFSQAISTYKQFSLSLKERDGLAVDMSLEEKKAAFVARRWMA